MSNQKAEKLRRQFYRQSNPNNNYTRTLEACLVVVLLLFILLFQAFKKVDIDAEHIEQIAAPFVVEEVPLTRIEKRSPPPILPKMPVPSDDPDIPADLSIAETELLFDDELPPAPSPPEIEPLPSEAFDSEPKPIGGMEAIRKLVAYPEYARRAGVEGEVTIRALIDRDGRVTDWEILKSLGHTGLDQAAVAAIQKAKWKPAVRKLKPAEEWVTIPFVFKLINP